MRCTYHLIPVALIVLLSLATVHGAAVAAVPAEADLYVSPRGNDAWYGKLAEPNGGNTDGPLATLDGARLAVRKIRQAEAKRDRAIMVLVRAGTYALTKPVTFTAEDSGTEKSPVVYAAEEGAAPVFSGGVRITGWAVGADGRWRVTLPDVKGDKWDFAQLFVDGHRRMRPRLPKEGYYRIAARLPPEKPEGGRRGAGDDRFRFPAGSIHKDWRNPGDIEVISFHPWFTSMLRIASVDAEKEVVAFTGRTAGPDAYAQLSAGTRFLVDNVAEALDAPGEWYLDKPTGELTYLPLPGESPDKTEVIAPRLETLVALAPTGDLKAEPKAPWVEHLTFRGLTFAHANWVTPKEGSSISQAAVSVPGAVHGRGLRNATFAGCTFTQLGTYGLELDAGCQDDRVESCRFTDLGAGGVKVGTPHVPPKPDLAVSRIELRQNEIAHLGRIHPAAVGVWIGQADHVTIEHNDIYDLYYTGISVGWTWGAGPSAAHHNEIAWNDVHHVGQGVLGDMGGIYTLGISPGTTIHHNRFHDIERFGYGGWGIYFDEGSTGIVAENNLVSNTHDGGLHQHYGEQNIYRNNVLYHSRDVQFGPSRLDWPAEPGKLRPADRALTIERNIVVGWGAASIIRTEWQNNKFMADHPEKFAVDRNVYWNAGKPVSFAGLSFGQWKQKGFDEHSVIADPLLSGVEQGQVRLGEDSPALKLGFKPFDLTRAGRTTGAEEPPEVATERWPRAFPNPNAPGARQSK